MIDKSVVLNRNPLGNGGGPVPAGFGIEVDTENNAMLVTQVVAGRSGAEAGVLPGDELLAIDGNRVKASSYEKVLDRLRAGEIVPLTLSRHGRLLTLEAEASEAIPMRFVITPRDRLSSRQKARLEAWLGRDLVFK